MNTRQKAKGPGYQMFWDREGDMMERLTSDFKAGRPMEWPVLSRALVHRVWSDFSRDGYVRDERALDNIFASIRDNVLRLRLGTVAAEHTEVAAAHFFEEHLTPEQCEPFATWMIESDDGWRISDYGLDPLIDAVALAFEAKTAAERLKYLDRALHVTHCRGDLSRLFVEGGRQTVVELDVETEDLATPA
jgi:hypothetical protein